MRMKVNKKKKSKKEIIIYKILEVRLIKIIIIDQLVMITKDKI